MKTTKTIYYLTFFAIILLGNSCKKEIKYENAIQGVVQNGTTGEIIPNVYVTLYIDSNPPGGNSMPEPFGIMERITDNNGNFYFDLTSIRKDTAYELRAEKVGYFSPNFQKVIQDKKGRYYHFILELHPKAYFNLYVKNIKKIFNNITIIQTPSAWPWNGVLKYNGYDIDTTILIDKWGTSVNSKKRDIYLSGNKSYVISWHLNDGNKEEHLRDTIYLPAFDTTKYEILY